MKLLAITRTATIAAGIAAALLAGCAQTTEQGSASGSGLVQVRLALAADSVSAGCPSGLKFPQVKSLRLRLFNGSPESVDSLAPLFDTSDPTIAPDGCLSFVQCTNGTVRIDTPGATQASRIEECKAAGGTTVEALEINVTDIEPNGNVTAWLEAFSDESCQDRVFVGLRGGIDIQADSDDRGYFIQPLCVGHFTELPDPGQEDTAFIRNVAGTSCATDCECIDAFSSVLKIKCSEAQKSKAALPGAPLQCKSGTCTTGHAFEDILTTPCDGDSTCTALYPSAGCGSDGFCRVTSYYPLDMKHGRAFHTATPLPDGRVLLVGGLASKTKGADGKTTFVAMDDAIEVYDPRIGIFSELSVAAAEQGALQGAEGRRAFHSATTMRAGKFLAITGGVQEASLRVAGTGDNRQLQIATPASTVAGDGTNMLANLFLVDTTSRTGRVKALGVDSGGKRTPQPFAMHTSSSVLSHATEELFVIGGIAPDGTPITQCDNKSTAPYADVATNCQVGDPAEASCKVNPCVLHAARAAAADVCFATGDDGICSAYAVIGGALSDKAPVGEVFSTPEGSGGSGSFAALTAQGSEGLRLAKFGTAVSDPANGRAWWFGGAVSTSFDAPANIATYELKLAQTGGQSVLEGTASDTSALQSASLPLRTLLAATQLDNGLILVTGGLDSKTQSTASALLFDPAANAYKATDLSMERSRFGHRATRIESGLLKGAVLITGGMSLGATATEPDLVPTAELYIPE